MRHSQQGRFRQQVNFLRRQFLQEGHLPFTDVLSAESLSQPLKDIAVCWKDRIFTPLVTLWVFLGQVLSADPSCRGNCRFNLKPQSDATRINDLSRNVSS